MACIRKSETWRGIVVGASGMFVLALAGSLVLPRSASRSGEEPCLHSGSEVAVGSWGRLEALRIPMVNTSGRLPDVDQRLAEPEWSFENVSEERLAKFLAASDMAPWQRKAFLNKEYWGAGSNGWTIHPPPLLISSLLPPVRARIYAYLARDTRNYAQSHPFRLSEAGFTPCLAAAGLPPASIARMQRLEWRDAASLCFSDLRVARQSLPPEQFENLVEVLYQQPAYRLRLRIEPHTDIEPLVKYWGKGGREKIVRPLLKSVTYVPNVPNGISITISKMLPPFPRVRLNTYPTAWDDPVMEQEDCFYTALNFFNRAADTNLLSRENVEVSLKKDYAPVAGNPEYGDLLLLLDATQHVFHCSVYMAGDFVYTKNGADPNQPWIFMKIRDMLLAYYGAKKPDGMLFVRRKEA